MTRTLLYKATRKIVGQGNSCCLIVPYKLKNHYFHENKSQGTWYFYKEENGDLTIEVKFSFLEKTETEKQTRKVVRTKFKPQTQKKDEWEIEGECEGCQQIGKLYKTTKGLRCKNCSST